MQPIKVKRIPERKCIGCGERRPKPELIRIVHTPEIFPDPTGKAPGRGAYVCPKSACLTKAQKSRRLEQALSTPVAAEVYEALRAELEAYGS